MYRTMITLAAILMICGTAMAADQASAGPQKATTPAVTSQQTTPIIDLVATGTGTDDAKPAKKVKKDRKAHKPRIKKEKKDHVRLPYYYKDVVTEEQKVEIYKIRKEYLTQIRELQQKINKLKEEQKKKIEALLTPEQKKLVEEKTKEAIEKRKAKAEARKAEKGKKAEKK